MHVFQLFVPSAKGEIEQSIADLQNALKEKLGEEISFQIVEILKNPHLAEVHKIEVTPTLQKTHPPPLRRFVGDIRNLSAIFNALQIF